MPQASKIQRASNSISKELPSHFFPGHRSGHGEGTPVILEQRWFLNARGHDRHSILLLINALNVVGYEPAELTIGADPSYLQPEI